MYEKSPKNQVDNLKFTHITDTHLLDRSDGTLYGLNTKKSLESVLFDSQARYPEIDFILFTGDISQTGSEQSYMFFRSIMQHYDLSFYCVPGNHDSPKLLQTVSPSTPDDAINIIQLGKFSLVLLSSWVENQHYGKITQRCLQQLEDHLINSDDQFYIIAIHHPPVLINSHWLNELGLQNRKELLQVTGKHPHNTLLLAGHIHQEIDQQLDNLRLLVTPSSCYQFKANSSYMHPLHTSPPAYRFIELSDTYKINTKVHYVQQPNNSRLKDGIRDRGILPNYEEHKSEI